MTSGFVFEQNGNPGFHFREWKLQVPFCSKTNPEVI
jgi:hypothetical protein